MRKYACTYLACGGRVVCLLEVPQPTGEVTEEPHCSEHLVAALQVDPFLKLHALPDDHLRIDLSTEQITPSRIEQELTDLLDRQETGTRFLEAHLERLADVKLEWEFAYHARLVVSEHKSEKQRHGDALLATKDLYANMRGEEVIVAATRARLSSLASEISAWQTMARQIAQQYAAS